MKVNFDIKMIDLDESIIDGKRLGKPVCEYIGALVISGAFKEGDLLRKYDLASRIARDKEIEVSLPDLKLIMSAIKCENNGAAPIVKAQSILALQAAEKLYIK